MTAIADIRNGIATRLRTIAGLNVTALGEWPDQVVPPAALIKAVAGQHEQAFGPGDARTVLQFEIYLALGLKGGLLNAQRGIELYLSNTGTSSLYVAFNADRYLGSTVNYTFIRGWRAYDVLDFNGQEFMGAIVDIEVDAA